MPLVITVDDGSEISSSETCRPQSKHPHRPRLDLVPFAAFQHRHVLGGDSLRICVQELLPSNSPFVRR